MGHLIEGAAVPSLRVDADGRLWRRIPSSGPFPWQPGIEYTVRETAPDVFEYVYREIEEAK